MTSGCRAGFRVFGSACWARCRSFRQVRQSVHVGTEPTQLRGRGVPRRACRTRQAPRRRIGHRKPRRVRWRLHARRHLDLRAGPDASGYPGGRRDRGARAVCPASDLRACLFCRRVSEFLKAHMPRDLPLCKQQRRDGGCRFRHPTLTQGLAAQAVERAMSTAILSWRAAIFSASLALAFCPPSSVLRMTRSALRAWARSRMASLRP